MELSRTINSDKRYYLDKKTIENAASLLETMRVFNDAKMDLYNALYDQKYLNAGPLLDHAYPVFLKEKYKTNDYYNAAIYTAASGQISSQKELKKYYKTTIAADLKNRDEKIQSVKEELDKKRAIKNSIRLYIKTKKWIKPYPKCQSKVRGFKIILFNKMMVNLDEYERKVEADIRKLKTRLALVTEARKRKAKKLENLEKLPPERIVFGGKKLYSEKDVVEVTKSDDSSNDKDQKTSKKASNKSPLTPSINGAKRWIPLGPVNLQPMEFVKISLALYLAYFMSSKQALVKTFSRGVIPPFAVTGLFCGLLLLQPDFGSAVVVASILFFMCLAGGTRFIYLFFAMILACA